jgi:hypothetical protein
MLTSARPLFASCEGGLAMPKFALLFLFAAIALPAFPSKPVSVEQLEKILETTKGESDRKVAHELDSLQLTVRINATDLARLQTTLPGKRSRQALMLLADSAEFFSLPPGSAAVGDKPPMTAQSRMLSLAIDYIANTLHQLPNLYATRLTASYFEEQPLSNAVQNAHWVYPPMHQVASTTETVLYRDGHEVVEYPNAKRQPYTPSSHGLVTKGVFGPILNTVMVDAVHGKITWGRWEQFENGRRAVFHYSVPRELSHYDVDFCCFDTHAAGSREFQRVSGYHGEMTLDAETGTVLRLTIIADMAPEDEVVTSEIMVDYSPVEIGGRSVTCPLRSVSISAARISDTGTRQTLLNDVSFSRYHLFRSESRLLVGNEGTTP